jgi:hypothetical protein
MPPKARRHIRKASSHALAVDSLRKQRLEVQTTLRTMRATMKKDDMLGYCTVCCQCCTAVSSRRCPGHSVRMHRAHCNVYGMSKENRKHARLMQKANRLGSQDLLEIAAMKGMAIFTDPNAPAPLSSTTEPPVGCGDCAASSTASSSRSSSSVSNVAAQQGTNCKTPLTSVVVQSELDEDALSHEHEPIDEDAHHSD